jgi:predicted dehydrogenase
MNTCNWGLIGCGDIARKRVAPALRDCQDGTLSAVTRARADLAASFAAEFGATKWYGTWNELLGDSEIDAVYIATPVNLHCEQTLAAAQSGKHVLCEKPMGMNTDECDRMMAACRTAGVKLGIAYYRHFYPVVGRIKEILASGEIGGVIIAQINAFELFNPSPGEDRYWFMKKDQAGGGPMFDFGCHRIEVLQNILGPIAFTRGFTDNVRFEREVEDTATAFFRFESGANAVLNVTHAALEPQDTLDIFCEDGSIHVPVLNEGIMTIVTKDGSRIEQLPPHQNFNQPLIDDFTRAVLTDSTPAVGGSIGREVNLIEEMIYGE